MVACCGVVVAPKPALSPLETAKLWRKGCDPSDWNHAMPSRTRSTTSVYVPAVLGAVYPIVNCLFAPTAMSPPRGIRGPSHITGLPFASRRWQLRSTGFEPLADHG